MKQRIDAIKDLRGTLDELGISGNPALWEIEFLKNPVEEVMLQIEAKDAELQKAPLVAAAYESMVKDIYDQMETVFGTRNDVSASAFASTWEAMLKRPASFIDVDLGLDDEAAVTAYATSKISSADAYGVFRLKRIGQYQAEKSAIEGA